MRMKRRKGRRAQLPTLLTNNRSPAYSAQLQFDYPCPPVCSRSTSGTLIGVARSVALAPAGANRTLDSRKAAPGESTGHEHAIKNCKPCYHLLFLAGHGRRHPVRQAADASRFQHLWGRRIVRRRDQPCKPRSPHTRRSLPASRRDTCRRGGDRASCG